MLYSAERGWKVVLSAEYDILYFAESGVFAIFAARYKNYEYNNRQKK